MASPQCCANPPTLSPASGENKVVDSFGGIWAYVAGAQYSKAAVVLISDIFGDLFRFPPNLDHNSFLLISQQFG